jgi:hypothetical protein
MRVSDDEAEAAASRLDRPLPLERAGQVRVVVKGALGAEGGAACHGGEHAGLARPHLLDGPRPFDDLVA